MGSAYGQFPVPDFVKKQPQEDSEKPIAPLKLRTRWQEKSSVSDGRQLIVFIRNEGAPIQDEEVAILIRGKTSSERRGTRTTITVASNKEIGVVVPLDKNETNNEIDFFGLQYKTEKPSPITQVKSVEVTSVRDLQPDGSVKGSPAVERVIKLGIRWEEEKMADGQRRIRVTIRNDGEDLQEEEAEILLKGKDPTQTRSTTTRITVARNEKIAVVVPLDSTATGNHIDFFGIAHDTEKTAPITEMQSVEVTIRSLKFTSP